MMPRRPAAGSCRSEPLEGVQHFLGTRVSTQAFLGKDERAVGDDLEPPSGGLDQLDGSIGVPVLDRGRQTGGSGPVVSDDAELDGDMHGSSFVTRRRADNPAAEGWGAR